MTEIFYIMAAANEISVIAAILLLELDSIFFQAGYVK